METFSYKIHISNLDVLLNTMWTLLLLIVCTSLVSCSEELKQDDRMLYEVNAPSQLIVRTHPNKNSDKILSLPDKSVVHVEAIENGWAHVISDEYDGYVNADYISFISTEPNNIETTSISNENSSGGNIKELGYKSLPYIILVLAIIAFVLIYIDEDTYLIWLLLLMSLAEFAYLRCMKGYLYDFWFLEPGEVGWLMVVVNYLLTFAILVFQGFLVWGTISRSSSGWFNGILNFIFSFLTGVSIFGIIGAFDKLDVVVVGLVGLFIIGLACILYYSQKDWLAVLKMGIINSIIVPVYLALLINMLSLIILVVLSLIGLKIFSSDSSGISSSNVGGLKRYVIYDDGERYELTQTYITSECDYQDQNGGRWEKTSSGFRRLG